MAVDQYASCWRIIKLRRIYFSTFMISATFLPLAFLFNPVFAIVFGLVWCGVFFMYLRFVAPAYREVICPACGHFFLRYNVFRQNCSHCGLKYNSML